MLKWKLPTVSYLMENSNICVFIVLLHSFIITAFDLLRNKLKLNIYACASGLFAKAATWSNKT